MNVIVTKDTLQSMLDNPNPKYVQQVVGRALKSLFERQTDEEKEKNRTEINNNIGFTGSDAKSGTITAKYFIKHGKLESWMIEKWTKKNPKGYSRLSKYHSQLNEIAIKKLSQKV